MDYNNTSHSLVRRSLVESSIKRWFKRSRKKYLSASKLLTKLSRPKKGIHIDLTREERMMFVGLIQEIYRKEKIVSLYREKYGRRPKLFYKKVFGFRSRDYQPVNVVWNTFNIHFIFDKNDLIAFQRKIQWGPGVGGYYPVGDTAVKIKDLRGMVSFGRREEYSIETIDIIKHESIHAFENLIKRRKIPSSKKSVMHHMLKSEINASLHNFKYSKKKRRRQVNMWARRGLGVHVKESVEDYLGYDETVKRIRNLKLRIRKCKKKREKEQLRERLTSLKQRLERKKDKKRFYYSLYRKNVNQIKKALEAIPTSVLQTIIFETYYERLYKKIPEAVKEYNKIKNEWYRK